ncbi:toll-like receptor 8 isoform X2 [Rhipicephalus microplus]|uniref:toll-like receptor 8 isoform X2 n=1 Tax=Rhipicephalus microplus TaxID=6941 RepID=UPI003F6B1994
MHPWSSRRPDDRRKLALVIIMALMICLSEAVRKRRRGNYTCPVLKRCSCLRRIDGLTVKCTSSSPDEEFDLDMAKLQGLFIVRFSMIKISMPKFPDSWFKNHTIARLRVIACGLREISDADMCCFKNLSGIQLDGNKLQGVPIALNAARALVTLLVRRNLIKHLQGMLDLPKLVRLDLSRNKIETLEEEYLTGLPKLRYLVLSQNSIHNLSPKLFRQAKSLVLVKLNNNHIHSVEGVFDHLSGLEVLDLNLNNICEADSIARFTLSSLKELTLEHNCISQITRFQNAQIQRLVFRENFLTNVTAGAFQQLKKLTTLDLSNNSIAKLSDSLFARNSVLQEINLSINKLTSALMLFNNTQKIKIIKLSFNRIVDISLTFNGLTQLRELYMRYNLISSIPDGAFQDNFDLVHIDFTSNHIAWIGKSAFKGLLRLRVLHLHKNKIISLNGSASNLPKLHYLGASQNAILRLEAGEFLNNLELTTISLAANNISNVEGAFIGAFSLAHLNLAANQLELLRRSDFSPDIIAPAVVLIEDNPLTCDCRLAWLMQEESSIQVRGIARCAKPFWLKGEQLSLLPHEDLLRWEDKCEPGCHCHCNVRAHAERDITVNCSSATAGRIPRVLPESTTQLDLSGNGLRLLDDVIKTAAPHLEVLVLKDNALISINVTSIPLTVNHLDLRGNKLKRLPLFLVTQLNLTSIWLSGNPYTCDCDDYLFRRWLQAHGNMVRDSNDIMCGRSSNLLVSRKRFITLGQNDLCPAAIPREVVYVLVAFGLLTVLLALSATYMRYKNVLRTWMRGHGMSCLARCLTEDDTDKLFDVFVSYSSKDASWIHDQILPELEARGLSYCTYERNFKGGYLLQDIIRDAVECSRRTLLVLTEQIFIPSDG